MILRHICLCYSCCCHCCRKDMLNICLMSQIHSKKSRMRENERKKARTAAQHEKKNESWKNWYKLNLTSGFFYVCMNVFALFIFCFCFSRSVVRFFFIARYIFSPPAIEVLEQLACKLRNEHLEFINFYRAAECLLCAAFKLSPFLRTLCVNFIRR